MTAFTKRTDSFFVCGPTGEPNKEGDIYLCHPEVYALANNIAEALRANEIAVMTKDQLLELYKGPAEWAKLIPQSLVRINATLNALHDIELIAFDNDVYGVVKFRLFNRAKSILTEPRIDLFIHPTTFCVTITLRLPGGATDSHDFKDIEDAYFFAQERYQRSVLGSTSEAMWYDCLNRLEKAHAKMGQGDQIKKTREKPPMGDSWPWRLHEDLPRGGHQNLWTCSDGKTFVDDEVEAKKHQAQIDREEGYVG